MAALSLSTAPVAGVHLWPCVERRREAEPAEGVGPPLCLHSFETENDFGGLTPYSGQPSSLPLAERRDRIIHLHKTTQSTLMKDNRTSKTMSGTFFLLHVLSWRVAAGPFAERFALSGAGVAPSSARGPFSGSVECSGGTRGLRKGLDSLSHDTFVIICSGQGIKRGTSSPHSRPAGNQLSTKDTFRRR